MGNEWIGGSGSGSGRGRGRGGDVPVIFLPPRRRGAEGNEGRTRLLGRGAFEGKIKKPRVLSEAGLLKGFCF